MIRFRVKGLPFEESVRGHAERRLQFALGRFVKHVRDVAVELRDTNGAKGGVDKRCRIAVRVSGRTLHAEDTASDVLVAIDGAADRIGRAVARELERRRSLPDRLSAAGPQW